MSNHCAHEEPTNHNCKSQVLMKGKREGNPPQGIPVKHTGAHHTLKGLEMNGRFFPIFSSILLLYSCLPHNDSSAVKKGNNTFICQAPALTQAYGLNLFFTFCLPSIILNT